MITNNVTFVVKPARAIATVVVRHIGTHFHWPIKRRLLESRLALFYILLLIILPTNKYR